MRTISLFFFCIVALFTQAQDFVIGGQAKSSASDEKYDSLRNFYTEPEDAKKMIGQEFTYYNMVDYHKGSVPYPWKDGRLRSGRYTSSQTALDAYIAEFKKKSGTKFKLTDFVSYEGGYGYVFTDSKGESFLYTNKWTVDGEFICDGYKEKFRKTYVGKDVYYTYKGKRELLGDMEALYARGCLIGLESRELKPILPYMSKWTIKGLGVDTTYWGKHTQVNDMDNMFCRLVFVIHNDDLGDYECYLDWSYWFENSSIFNDPPKFIIANSLEMKPTAWGSDISTGSWQGTIPVDILSKANTGEPNALYAIINYYNKYGRSNKIINLSYDDYVELLNKAVDSGHIDNRTSQWLYNVATHYMPYVISLDKDGKNDYKKGIPYLMKAARLGNSDAIETLIEAIDEGKTSENEALNIIQDHAEENNAVKLFLGRQILKGKKINSSEEIVNMLQELGNSNYSGNIEALLILSECYEKGIGIEKNVNKALELLIKAADKNDQTACFLLGEKYYIGNGVNKDLDKSAYYLKKGITLEHESIGNIGYKYFYMLGKIQASKSDSDCITNFQKTLYCSADPPKYVAAIELGNLYYEGKMVKKDEGIAAYYFWDAYKEGKIEEGKRLFERYQLKDKLINYLNEQKAEGDLTDDYVEEMIQSLNK